VLLRCELDVAQLPSTMSYHIAVTVPIQTAFKSLRIGFHVSPSVWTAVSFSLLNQSQV
jgi:hypothetical protein